MFGLLDVGPTSLGRSEGLDCSSNIADIQTAGQTSDVWSYNQSCTGALHSTSCTARMHWLGMLLGLLQA